MAAAAPNKDLISAIIQDNVDKMDDAIKRGADIKIIHKGITLLHLAVFYNSISAAAFLIEKGIDINRKSEMNETPLQMALRLNQERNSYGMDMADFLYENGAETTDENLERLGVRELYINNSTNTANNTRPATPPPREPAISIASMAPVATPVKNGRQVINNRNAELRVVMNKKGRAYLSGIDLSAYGASVDIVEDTTEFMKHAYILMAHETDSKAHTCTGIGTEYVIHAIQSCDFFIYYVLHTNPSKVLGFATCNFKWTDLYDSEMLYVDLICTNNKLYAGVGTLIMNTLKAIAAFTSTHIISLNSVSTAEGFYKKMGFNYNARPPGSKNTKSMTLRVGRKSRRRKTRRGRSKRNRI